MMTNLRNVLFFMRSMEVLEIIFSYTLRNSGIVCDAIFIPTFTIRLNDRIGFQITRKRSVDIDVAKSATTTGNLTKCLIKGKDGMECKGDTNSGTFLWFLVFFYDVLLLDSLHDGGLLHIARWHCNISCTSTPCREDLDGPRSSRVMIYKKLHHLPSYCWRALCHESRRSRLVRIQVFYH